MNAAFSRRRLLQMGAAGIVASNVPAEAAAPPTSLATVAAANGYLFGSAAAEVIDSDPAYRELYVTQTKLITTDVALKMGRIAALPGPKQFETGDKRSVDAAHLKRNWCAIFCARPHAATVCILL